MKKTSTFKYHKYILCPPYYYNLLEYYKVQPLFEAFAKELEKELVHFITLKRGGGAVIKLL